jgi:hypothetical protein
MFGCNDIEIHRKSSSLVLFTDDEKIREKKEIIIVRYEENVPYFMQKS